jgi:hypothetical protein
MNHNQQHNLDINMYSFKELLGLFDLGYTPTDDQMRRAKKKVLMTHPDKSKLSPEYFFFYKKAFEIILNYVENNRKTTKIVVDTDYQVPTDENANNDKTIKQKIKKMKKDEFHKTFNRMYEENMVSKEELEARKQKYDWFQKEETNFKIETAVSVKNMGDVFNTMKTKNQGLVKYEGVKELTAANGVGGSNLYEELAEEDTYVTCDPFAKLKYDDLRKVHKDQTIFSICDEDFEKIPKYSSVDNFQNERDQARFLTPLEKGESEALFKKRETESFAKMNDFAFRSGLRTDQYQEKNKAVLSNFLRLGNN